MKISDTPGGVSVKSIGIVLVFCGFSGAFSIGFLPCISRALQSKLRIPQSASSHHLAVAIYEHN